MIPTRSQTAIIIIGGHNSVWPAYLKMARDLEDISGLPTVGVPVMFWDWHQADRHHDATNLLSKLDETVAWARRKHQARRLVLVGHSAGGLLARLYLSSDPVWGQTYQGLEYVSSVITLGSPHLAAKGSNTRWYLADEANRLVPGTPYATKVHYRTVVGRSIPGNTEGSYRERRAHRYYEFFAEQGNTWGDGLVPVECAGLDGTKLQILEGVTHSRKIGRNWYGGSRAIARLWWPRGLGHAG